MSSFADAAKRYLDFLAPRVDTSTLSTLRSRFANWLKVCPDAWPITTEVIEQYRNASLSSGFSNRTIESTVSAVAQVAEFHGAKVDVGQRLRARSLAAWLTT